MESVGNIRQSIESVVASGRTPAISGAGGPESVSKLSPLHSLLLADEQLGLASAQLKPAARPLFGQNFRAHHRAELAGQAQAKILQGRAYLEDVPDVLNDLRVTFEGDDTIVDRAGLRAAQSHYLLSERHSADAVGRAMHVSGDRRGSAAHYDARRAISDLANTRRIIHQHIRELTQRPLSLEADRQLFTGFHELDASSSGRIAATAREDEQYRAAVESGLDVLTRKRQ